MLLTISTTHTPATDLGFLLHKHPDKVQRFALSTGVATVFYPEASHEKCTAALLLDVDSLRLARSRPKNSPDFTLAQYVNDRSYAASSLLAVALGKVFTTARSGRCVHRPELAATPLPLSVTVPVLPCRGGVDVARRVFEPLEWDVAATPIPLDPAMPHWGDSHYLRLTLTGTMLLSHTLNQLHVLLPVLDESKHYWQGPDEVDKLLRSGGGWLADHPAAELITRRYLGRRSALTRAALARLAELGDDTETSIEPQADEESAQPQERRVSLNAQRHEAVHRALHELGVTSVIDLGCGAGQFLTRLVADPSFVRVGGCDVSLRALKIAARRLHLGTAGERQAERISLFHSALTYEDTRLAGFGAAVLMEVIEHVDPGRLDALERVVFGAGTPSIIVTTPNSEYNVNYEGLRDADGRTRLRHSDHRFEWTRAEFATWAQRVADSYRYAVQFRGVGDLDPQTGTPTQMAVFTRV